MKYLLMPQLTPYLSLTTGRADITLATQGLAYCYHQLPPGEEIPKGAEENFTIGKRITWRINDISDLDDVQSHFSTNKKRQIKKAADLIVSITFPSVPSSKNKSVLEPISAITPEQFYDLHALWLSERGRRITYGREYFQHLAYAAFEHHSAAIISLRKSGKANELYACAFLVFDEATCYYLIPTFNPRYADSGAGARLALESIRFAHEQGCRIFDFEGGNNSPSIANHYKQFGTTPTEYFTLERYSNPLVKIAVSLYKRLSPKPQ